VYRCNSECKINNKCARNSYTRIYSVTDVKRMTIQTFINILVCVYK